MINAIILSGDKNESLSGGYTKALARIKDRFMIEYVVEALHRSATIGEIAVVGPTIRLRECLGDRVSYIVEGMGDLIDNTLLGAALSWTNRGCWCLPAIYPILPRRRWTIS